MAALTSTSLTALCAANVQRVQELTVGFWQDIYKGDLGRARVGLQYEYVALTLFSGATAIPGTAFAGGPTLTVLPTPVCTRTTTSSSSRSATIPSTKRNGSETSEGAVGSAGGAF